MTQDLFVLLAFLPILCLVVVSLLADIKIAAGITFVVTTALFFLWDSSFSYFFASLAASFFSTMNILLIVIGAVFLFNVMQSAGLIDVIKESLMSIHPSKEVLFFFISISLTAFFEGIAGFGTPGAIVPPISISMGFNPVKSIATVLLMDGLFAVFGAVGTPLVAGMFQVVSLPEEVSKAISMYSAFFIAMVGIVFFIFIFRLYNSSEGEMKHQSKVVMMYVFYMVPFLLASWLVFELATVLSAAVMLVTSFFYLSKRKVSLPLKPWIPYLALLTLLLLPKLIPSFSQLLDIEVGVTDVFGTSVSAAIKPLKSPFIPFLLVGLGVLFSNKGTRIEIKPIVQKVLSVFIVLFPIIAVSQMMLNSGTEQDSMVSMISHAFLGTGTFYVGVAPFMGILGSFITGSTTISNIIFSASQLEVAELLSLNTSVVLALQHSGAAIGNAVCLFNIVAAASVVGIREESSILKLTILPTLVAGVLLGIMGFVFTLVF